MKKFSVLSVLFGLLVVNCTFAEVKIVDCVIKDLQNGTMEVSISFEGDTPSGVNLEIWSGREDMGVPNEKTYQDYIITSPGIAKAVFKVRDYQFVEPYYTALFSYSGINSTHDYSDEIFWNSGLGKMSWSIGLLSKIEQPPALPTGTPIPVNPTPVPIPTDPPTFPTPTIVPTPTVTPTPPPVIGGEAPTTITVNTNEPKLVKDSRNIGTMCFEVLTDTSFTENVLLKLYGAEPYANLATIGQQYMERAGIYNGQKRWVLYLPVSPWMVNEVDYGIKTAQKYQAQAFSVDGNGKLSKPIVSRIFAPGTSYFNVQVEKGKGIRLRIAKPLGQYQFVRLYGVNQIEDIGVPLSHFLTTETDIYFDKDKYGLVENELYFFMIQGYMEDGDIMSEVVWTYKVKFGDGSIHPEIGYDPDAPAEMVAMGYTPEYGDSHLPFMKKMGGNNLTWFVTMSEPPIKLPSATTEGLRIIKTRPSR